MSMHETFFNYKIFLVCIFISFYSFGQNDFIFKSDVVQITFPRKPYVDSVTFAGGFKIRFVSAKDSLSNYYLSIIEQLQQDPKEEEPKKDLAGYFDGVMDGMGEGYKVEILSKSVIKINADSLGEYYMKGMYGKTPIFIRARVCIKGRKTIVCQHLYAVTNEHVLKTKQQVFFQSMTL